MNERSGAIFLSYASEDTAAAQRICAALREASIEVWFDQSELRGGDAWDTAIRAQIKSCALFVPIISSHSRARMEGYFRLEWKLAVDRSHRMAAEKAFLIPVVIDDTKEADARVPDSFREIRWTHLPDGGTTPEFVGRIHRLLTPIVAGLEPLPNPDDLPAGRTSPPYRPPVAWVALGALLVATAAYVGLSHRSAHLSRLPGAERPAVPPASPAAPDKSIAVLPFTDLSEKRDQQYFSDGLSEELIDLLAQIPDLKVTARTSSFAFRDRPVTVAEIGRALGVANLLEGSVRKAGNTIRITAQLVRADNGFNLWSATYDRDLKDVFMVQDDIAGVVVDKLKLTLAGGAPPAPAARTANTEAHNLLLQGEFAVQSDTDAGTTEALQLFRRAIAIDAGYAAAWNGIGYAELRRGTNGYDASGNAYRIAEQSVRRAIQLDPGLADAYAILGTLQMLKFEWQTSSQTRAHALRLDPGNVNALLNRAVQTLITGTHEEAIAQMHDVLDRDPFNLLSRRYAARLLYYTGRLDDAERLLRQIIAVNPNFSAAHYELGRVLLARGNTMAAIAEFEAEGNPGWRSFGLPLGYHAAGRQAEADAAMQHLLANPASFEFQIAEAYAAFGDADEAFVWLNRAVSGDPGVIWLRYDPLLARLTTDPRYRIILRRMNLPLTP